MRINSSKTWKEFSEHALNCAICRRCTNVGDPVEQARLCGEGTELLQVARMHSREEIERP